MGCPTIAVHLTFSNYPNGFILGVRDKTLNYDNTYFRLKTYGTVHLTTPSRSIVKW